MTRKALIISNAGEANAANYCKGVAVDVGNYTTFLQSPVGGAWRTTEVLHLDRPTSAQLQKEISDLKNLDYSFIAFAGHGYFSQKSLSTILELRSGEEYDSVKLRESSKKRTIVLDCCRRIHRDVTHEAVAKMAALREGLNLDPAQCRIYFDRAVEKCADGVVVTYACAVDQVAGDSELIGGFYSSSLIASGKALESTTQIDLKSQFKVLSIAQTHDAALPSVHRLSGGTQTPKIEKPRSEPHFPFAVIA